MKPVFYILFFTLWTSGSKSAWPSKGYATFVVNFVSSFLGIVTDDIAVRFVEQDDDGTVMWESFGNFGPFDVHRQVRKMVHSVHFEYIVNSSVYEL